MDKSIPIKICMLTCAVFIGEAYSLSRRFVKHENLGFRQKEGTDTAVWSFIECAAMCCITRCSNFYYKLETQQCNLETTYAVSPISDPQENWAFFADHETGANLALDMVATQSSTYNNDAINFGAFYAVDGKIANIRNGPQATHTELEKQPWPNINFGSTHKIDRVVLYNRQALLGERLQYFRVDVIQKTDIKLCGFFNYMSKSGETIIIMCHDKPEGGEIRIMLTQEGYLSLSEVKVYESI